MKKAIIFSNGEYKDYDYYKNRISSDDLVICTDGAVVHCLNAGVIPDLWIGDFDSCKFSDLTHLHKELNNCEIIKLKSEKDETDTHVACDIALSEGCTSVIIWGAFGKRIDHMLGNIAMLEYLNQRGIEACAEDEKNRISVADKHFSIKKEKKYLSIIPLDDAVAISKTIGLKYPLKNENLYRSVSRGISNEITGSVAEIFISSGKALIIESDD